MPIYEYTCKSCKKDFELLVRNSCAVPVCPECGSKDLTKKLSVFSAKADTPASHCAHADTCPSAGGHSCGCGCGCGHHHH